GIEFIKHARRGEPQRRGSFARRPNVHQAIKRVLLLLQPELEPRRSGHDGAAAETIALVPDYRLDRTQQLGRGNDSHGDAGAAKYRFDDLAMAEARNDDPVLQR